MGDGTDTARMMKRRGILAAAGAVVAGIAAKQAAQPALAAYTLMGDTTNTSTTTTTIQTTAGFGGFAVLNLDASAANTSVPGMMVHGGNVTMGDGGDGMMIFGGNTSDPARRGGIGIYIGAGSGYQPTSGIYCVNGKGVGIVSVQGPPGVAVLGDMTGTPTPASAAGGIGVQGTGGQGIGVYGTTSGAGQYGVLGQTLADNAFGLTGIANTNGSAAFAGATTNPSSFAGYFQGHVQVDGAFDVIGAGNKHAVVAHPDGSHRTIYSIESPECWLEDFGEGTLTAGKADVKFDADFSALIYTDHYHVFITPHSADHLYVAQRTAGGFTVMASAPLTKATGGDAAQASETFSWRIVAKPKTDARVERLAKATLAPKIDTTKLPKPSAALPRPPPPKKA